MTPTTACGRLAVFVALVSLIPATAVGSRSSEVLRNDVKVDVLKEIYLNCERAAVRGDLDTGAIMRCSEVYEDLKRRAFGNDFKRLKAWADAQFATEDALDRAPNSPAVSPGATEDAAKTR